LRCALARCFLGLLGHDVYLSFNGLLTRGITCFSEGNTTMVLPAKLCNHPEEIIVSFLFAETTTLFEPACDWDTNATNSPPGTLSWLPLILA